MNAHGAIRSAMTRSDFLVKGYLADLTDAELLVRPVPGANHIAWQLGHLIVAEHKMVNAASPGAMPTLPTGFAAKHLSETAGVDDPAAFCTKEEYLQLYEQQRAATLAALEKTTEADLDRPGPKATERLAPTVGDLFMLQGVHWSMHAGQWAVTRRKLGRKPLF